MKIFKISAVFLCIAFSVIFVIAAVMFIKQIVTDVMINDSVATMAFNVKYGDSAAVRGVPAVKQKSNGGYACIEMLAEYLGKTITEEMLEEENNGRNSVSTNGGLWVELQKQFPEFKITQYKNLKNSEMLEKIYDSLANNMPVIFAYAAPETAHAENAAAETETETKTETVWKMYYGIAVEIDLQEDKVIFNNTQGYVEKYAVNDFLKATRYENYENMEFHLRLGFAIETFAKNTLFILESPESEQEEETGETEETE